MSARFLAATMTISVGLFTGCAKSHLRSEMHDDPSGLPGANDAGGFDNSRDADQEWPEERSDASAPDAGLGDSGSKGGASHASAFVPAPNRVDMVHDAKRELLYITTKDPWGDTGSVLRWDLRKATFLDPLLDDGAFLGVDLSPDGDTLVVADASQVGPVNWVHLVDLKTGHRRKIEFPIDELEGGTFMPIFLDATTLLVSSQFKGSGGVPLRKVDLRDDSITVIDGVDQDSMLALSADGSTVGIAQSNASNGPLKRYDVASGNITEVDAGCFLYEIGISQDGSQLAVPNCGGTTVYDADLKLLATIGGVSNAFPQPVATVYSPVSDVMYVAWNDFDWSDEPDRRSIDAYSTKTLTPIKTIEPATPLFTSNGNYAFVSGRLRISRDGKQLFASIEGGIAIYAIGDELQALP